MLVPYRCCNKSPQTLWLRNAQKSPAGLTGSKSGCQGACVPFPRRLGEEALPCLPGSGACPGFALPPEAGRGLGEPSPLHVPRTLTVSPLSHTQRPRGDAGRSPAIRGHLGQGRLVSSLNLSAALFPPDVQRAPGIRTSWGAEVGRCLADPSHRARVTACLCALPHTPLVQESRAVVAAAGNQRVNPGHVLGGTWKRGALRQCLLITRLPPWAPKAVIATSGHVTAGRGRLGWVLGKSFCNKRKRGRPTTGGSTAVGSLERMPESGREMVAPGGGTVAARAVRLAERPLEAGPRASQEQPCCSGGAARLLVSP